MDLHSAYTAIPRRTAGFRLVSEPRPELVEQPRGPRLAERVLGAAVAPVPVPAKSAAPGARQGAKAAGREQSEGRERLRLAIQDRLGRDLADVSTRLRELLSTAGRSGLVNLSLVLSESFVAQELWKEPRRSPEARDRLLFALALPPRTEPGVALGALVSEVHQAFTEFRASRAGQEAFAHYQELLGRFEQAQVLLILAGHDGGPMREELQRLGVTAPPDFTRSLLLDERVLAVGPSPGAPAPGPQLPTFLGDPPVGPVGVAGLSTTQLAMVVAQLRQLNPRLTNRQVRHVLARVLQEVRADEPRTLGRAQVERMQELARQLLRLEVTGRLCP
jgi:hypothetical protein